VDTAGIRAAIQIQPDTALVAHQFRGPFFETHVEDIFPPQEGRMGEMGGEGGLARAGLAGVHEGAAQVRPLTAEHAVQPGNAGGDPLRGCAGTQLRARYRQDEDPFVVDQERELIGFVAAAAFFDHPEKAGHGAVVQLLLEFDDAVGHIVLNPVLAAEIGSFAGGDQGGSSTFTQPVEYAAEFIAQTGPGADKGLLHAVDAIYHQPLCAGLFQGMADAGENGGQFKGLPGDHIAADRAHVQNPDFPLGGILTEIQPQDLSMVEQSLGGFVEGDQHTGFAVDQAMAEDSQGENGFSGARSAAQQGGAGSGQAAVQNEIQTLDAGGRGCRRVFGRGCEGQVGGGRRLIGVRGITFS